MEEYNNKLDQFNQLNESITSNLQSISQNISKLSIIKNLIKNVGDKYEWYAVDVSNEYTDEYNMKRCFNKYGDTFLIRSSSVTTIENYEIHECHVNTAYGPNIQYKFISEYVYIPSWIKDKDNDKIIYHVNECDFIMKNDTVNCSSKKFEFGEGWNRILFRYSSTLEYIKINSDCSSLGIGNNSVLKDVDISECYQLTYCEIINNPLIKNKCFTTRCTPDQFLTTNNNNTYLDVTQNWFISGDGLWRGKFMAGWHYQDVEFFDRFGNGLIARINDSDNDSGFYKTLEHHDIVTDYFKFPSIVTFSNDLYNDKRLIHVPRVAMNVYTDSSFTTKSMTSNARILDFSNGIIDVDWSYDNLVEKIIVSPSTTSLNFIYDTALKSINLVDCDKLDKLTIQNCPNITQIVLQHRPSNLNVDDSIKVIILDEINDSITSNTSSITTINSSITTLDSRVTTLEKAEESSSSVNDPSKYFSGLYKTTFTGNDGVYYYNDYEDRFNNHWKLKLLIPSNGQEKFVEIKTDESNWAFASKVTYFPGMIDFKTGTETSVFIGVNYDNLTPNSMSQPNYTDGIKLHTWIFTSGVEKIVMSGYHCVNKIVLPETIDHIEISNVYRLSSLTLPQSDTISYLNLNNCVHLQNIIYDGYIKEMILSNLSALQVLRVKYNYKITMSGNFWSLKLIDLALATRSYTVWDNCNNYKCTYTSNSDGSYTISTDNSKSNTIYLYTAPLFDKNGNLPAFNCQTVFVTMKENIPTSVNEGLLFATKTILKFECLKDCVTTSDTLQADATNK